MPENLRIIRVGGSMEPEMWERGPDRGRRLPETLRHGGCLRPLGLKRNRREKDRDGTRSGGRLSVAHPPYL